ALPGFAHLFVSVKQVADGSPDSALKLDGSSAISSGWLERHLGSNEFTFDGTWPAARGGSPLIPPIRVTSTASAHSFLARCTCSSAGTARATLRLGTRIASSSPARATSRSKTEEARVARSI